MGLLTTSAPDRGGGYSNPGNPLRDLFTFGDNIRGTFIDLPVLIVTTAIAYDMVYIEGEDNEWGVGDLILVVAIAYVIKRMGVASRWKGVL